MVPILFVPAGILLFRAAPAVAQEFNVITKREAESVNSRTRKNVGGIE
jgi:hypothetical protein